MFYYESLNEVFKIIRIFPLKKEISYKICVMKLFVLCTFIYRTESIPFDFFITHHLNNSIQKKTQTFITVPQFFQPLTYCIIAFLPFDAFLPFPTWNRRFAKRRHFFQLFHFPNKQTREPRAKNRVRRNVED